ncbi:MAG: extracellular solute-binding protein [Chloroflexi bacterium]|nr:extracellular solute-binding protein [Chloroflexota bacterium]
MNRLLWISLIILVVGSASLGCREATQPPPSEAGTPLAKVAAPASKAAWELQWDTTVAEARKEGKLLFLGSIGGAFKDIGLDRYLHEKFGITMDIMAGGASELIPKMESERRAGLYLEDVFLLSPGTMVNSLKPAGLTQSLDQILFLPEVLDPRAWYKGELPWVDKEHHQLNLLAMPIGGVAINTELVKPEEIKSYRDLLSPKWKGKMVLVDPTQSGGGLVWFTAMAEGIMDLNYLRELARQEPVISRNDRLMVEWVARGRYPVLLGIRTDLVAEMQRAGAPIQFMSLADGAYVSTSSGGLTVLKNPSHPNASKLFANWILTKEGGTWVSKAFGGQSTRVDVPTDAVDPKQLRQPGVKYIDGSTEQFALKQWELMKVAQEIFSSSLK